MSRHTPTVSRRWTGIGLTDQGRVRSSNQDAFAVLNDEGAWLVADGMGGRAGGDVASRLVAQAVAEYLAARPGPLQAETVGAALREAVRLSNQAVRGEAVRCPELLGMGTTLVLLLILPSPEPMAWVANVGDSRAYLLRQETLMPLTRDHSLLEESIRTGLLSEVEARTHPLRHVLTRAVGTELDVEPDITMEPLEPGDLLLLCTDGLTKMLPDDRIEAILRQSFESAREACEALIRDANSLGGEDNITVLVVRSEEGR